MKTVSGLIVDVVSQRKFKAVVSFDEGRIVSIRESDVVDDCVIIPGLVDAHVHVESSLLPPAEFGRVALLNGVMAAVADPHEIANVLGVAGVEYMVREAEKTKFKFLFAAPSCVPATNLETSGAVLDSKSIENLFQRGVCSHLGEMMNFPGVLFSDEEVLAKLRISQNFGKRIDGHAPGLLGGDLKKYIAAGVLTDHECVSLDEAVEKINAGMKILIRQGSAAKNLKALAPLLQSHPDDVMLCSDDIHADDLLAGYVLNSVRELLTGGYDLFNVLRAASFLPAKFYGLDLGMLQVGDKADFVVLDNLVSLNVQSVYVSGEKIGNTGFVAPEIVNNFKAQPISEDDLKVVPKSNTLRVVEIVDRELLTNELLISIDENSPFLNSNTEIDVLKIVVHCRYKNEKPFVGFVKGFGINKGAVATSVSHDSHNIIAVGVDDAAIVTAINTLVDSMGGICYAAENIIELLELPIAGLMSDKSAELVAEKYHSLESVIRKNGSKLNSPIMNLSFLALLVIPCLKINERGLFDFKTFSFVDLFV
jgi:adenine deaminase